MIPVVNPNKHVQNDEDGGRKRKVRHVSKIEHLRQKGKDAIKECCANLFGAGLQNDKNSPRDGCQKDVDWSFPEIPEAKLEESPSPF